MEKVRLAHSWIPICGKTVQKYCWCCSFSFRIFHILSPEDRSGLLDGHSSTCNIPHNFFHRHSFVIYVEFGFAFSCWKMHRCPWKWSLEGSTCCSEISVNFSAFTDMEMSFAEGSDTAPCNRRPWLFDILLTTVWMVLFIFGSEHRVSNSSNKGSWMLNGLTAIHVSTTRLCDDSEPSEVGLVVVSQTNPFPMWLYQLLMNDDFWCTAVWGMKDHVYPAQACPTALYMLKFF